MTLVGSTAIEDKLQVGAPDTIARRRRLLLVDRAVRAPPTTHANSRRTSRARASSSGCSRATSARRWAPAKREPFLDARQEAAHRSRDAGATDSVRVFEKVSVKGVPPDAVGFRPDWNPPGFRYKRLESAALKGKTSRLDAIR